MSEDDVAYTALLTQLLSDTSTTRNARVHSWIEHQYDFALSEQDYIAKHYTSYPSLANSRSPSPSPSSSLGAHRTFSIDRPDSPLLPRLSTERPSSPRTDPCPSYDALFFSTTSSPQVLTEDEELEERERERALRFLVQEMAHWKMQSAPATPHKSADKPLPPPPSPASSTTQSISSRALRSRSSSMRISRLPSFTSTLSSDQSQPQDIFTPPLPVSVIIHGESHHELVLRHEHPHVDRYLHQRSDFFTHQLLQSQEQELHLLSPIQDDKDSAYPSPTLSSFSCTYSRETSVTTPYTSFPASPASATFATSGFSPENIALPASPQDEQVFLGEDGIIGDRDVSPNLTALPASPVTFPITNVFPATPTSSFFSTAVIAKPDDIAAQPQHLRALKSGDHSQSRWSVATTASVTQSGSEPKTGSFLSPRTPSKGKKNKELQTPRKRTRFISLISRLSPGRSEASSATTTTSTAAEEYDSANESDAEEGKDRGKEKKAMSKKSSLASLRASFSLSRASFSSQRPPLSSPTGEVPPLPTSPTRTSFSASRPSLTEGVVASEVVPPVPKIMSLSRIPSRANHLDNSLPPIPQSASTITSFGSSSQVSISQTPATSASASRVSLLPPNAHHSASRISLIPPPSKRTSLASAAGIEAPVSIHPMPASETSSRSKSIFRLSTKPRTPKGRTVSGPKATPSKLPVPGNTSMLQPISVESTISSAPTKFTPPAKLASVLASQSQRLVAPAPTSSISSSPILKLPTAPSRIAPPSKLPRSPATMVSVVVTDDLPSAPLTSKLPLPASAKGTRVGTVRGFWRRQ
ncbi:hypothetical protein BS17DRAFT_777243 [Gyrodon lividus]|nr:hypothetical protein BS17DRAFT_777243 [Gyrodon lividus]